MRKHFKEITLILVVVIAACYIFVDSKKDVGYHFKGEYRTEPENITVDVFMMKNGKGNLLNYNTDVFYSETDIKGTLFYYLKNGEKRILLGGSRLSSYDYSKRNANKKEYGVDYFDVILDNANNLYFDLCRDVECKDVFKTLKLEMSKMF